MDSRKLNEIAIEWDGRDRFFKRIKRRRKYRKLIRLKNRIHLYLIELKDYLK